MSEQVIDVGDSVACDLCNEEYRGRSDSGGFLFGSYAVCPACAPAFRQSIKSNHEETRIRAECPPGMSFHAWVMRLRGGVNEIRIITGARE